MPRINGLRRFFRLADARRGVDVRSIDDELRFHLETRVDELIALGTPEEEARSIARHEFGDPNRYRTDCFVIDSHFARETRMRDFVQSIGADLRHAARGLRAQPAFASIAIVTLALGIGATTSVFSAVSGVLLRPLPYPHAEQLVQVGEQALGSDRVARNTSFENFDDWRRRSTSFAAMGIVGSWTPTLTGHGDPMRVPTATVGAEIFDVFSVRPALGRRIVPSDNLQGAASVGVLSDDFWRSRFGADPSIIGTSIMLNGAPLLVVGVLPRGFSVPGRLDRAIWSNFVSNSSDGRGGRSKEVYARLKPGVALVRAQAEMNGIASDLATQFPKDNQGRVTLVEPLATLLVGDVRRPLFLLLGASFVVLLIACANLSNLLLARGTTRTRELAVRAALGAGRGRITRQLLTESLLLALVGAIGGIAIAAASIRMLVAVGPSVFQTRPPSLSIDVLLASIALSCLTAMVFGLLPALRLAPANPQIALRHASARVAGGQGSRSRTMLAVAQLALAVVLLSASALVIKSFLRVLRVDPGVRVDHVLTASVVLPPAYNGQRSTQFYTQLLERVRAIPGVVDVATTGQVPFSGNFDRVGISRFEGEPERLGAAGVVGDRYVVSASYFKTMGIRLLQGRLPGVEDRFDAPTVAVVDELFAKHAFDGRNPIGRKMEIPGRARTDFATIVGVVNSVKTYGLDADSPGQIYLSNEQFPWRFSSVVVRTTGEPTALTPALTRIVHELDQNQPVSNVATLESLLETLLRGRRFVLTLLGAFAVTALTLSVIGLYGVVAYGVSQRRREFGVRMALGARRSEIARMILMEGGRVGAAGAGIGILGAYSTSHFISSMLFEVGARDTAVFALVAGGLVAVALIASIVPAHRATTIDAAEVLRGD